MAIRGTSAGGLTALGALIRADRFAGAASWYGVTDLEALAADTHDFESRYLDSLVGPWPAAADRYRERSPIHHPDRVSGRVLLLQGADDPVVPADQSERFAERLRRARRPLPAGRVRRASPTGSAGPTTIEACLDAELDFYRIAVRPRRGPRPRLGDRTGRRRRHPRGRVGRPTARWYPRPCRPTACGRTEEPSRPVRPAGP